MNANSKMMTEETLNTIIEGAKKQQRHENTIMDCFKAMFPGSYSPVPENPLWDAFAIAVDAALGVEDLFGWWVWETDCGTKDNSWIELDGRRYPLTTAGELLAYAEAEMEWKMTKEEKK